jgi:hypothetical protein
MEVPVKELVSAFVAAVNELAAGEEEDVFLQGLVDDFQSSSALFKRDMRRRLEKDPPTFLRSACRILKAGAKGPGALYLMELLWENPVLGASLLDPVLLPLNAAIGFAKRWSEFDPMLDIKLLHLGFPTDGAAVRDGDIVRAKRVLALVTEMPAQRHILFPLVNLLRSPDPQVRSKAATLYGRTSHNAEWVRGRLEESDPRVRANAVESLWGERSEAALAVLKEAARDRHHRVAANALIGLAQLDAREVSASLKKMVVSEDPLARSAAAFAMGRIGRAEYVPILEGMVKDSGQHARSQALKALIRIRKLQRQAAGIEPEQTAHPEETVQPQEPEEQPVAPEAPAVTMETETEPAADADAPAPPEPEADA